MKITDTSLCSSKSGHGTSSTGCSLGAGWKFRIWGPLCNCDCGLKLVSVLKFEKHCSRTFCKQWELCPYEVLSIVMASSFMNPKFARKSPFSTNILGVLKPGTRGKKKNPHSFFSNLGHPLFVINTHQCCLPISKHWPEHFYVRLWPRVKYQVFKECSPSLPCLQGHWWIQMLDH